MNEPRFNDLDKMPFGKFKGTPMQDVPASYLHWFYCNCEAIPGRDSEKLLNYIKHSMSALRSENPDLIWQRNVR